MRVLVLDPWQWAVVVLIVLAHFASIQMVRSAFRALLSISRFGKTSLDESMAVLVAAPIRLAASIAIFYGGAI